jgi:hypothetical protein
MGLIKNEHGVFRVRLKVLKRLEVATARAMGVPKERVSWLKETLGTKDEKQAKVLVKTRHESELSPCRSRAPEK